MTAVTLIDTGPLMALFELMAEHERVAQLMKRYADLPMSMVDACLVRIAAFGAAGALDSSVAGDENKFKCSTHML